MRGLTAGWVAAFDRVSQKRLALTIPAFAGSSGRAVWGACENMDEDALAGWRQQLTESPAVRARQRRPGERENFRVCATSCH
jgi:hypothetical protein